MITLASTPNTALPYTFTSIQQNNMGAELMREVNKTVLVSKKIRTKKNALEINAFCNL
ncbi:MAG: hypothetical protein ACI840_000433 [Ulvibacter sp.]